MTNTLTVWIGFPQTPQVNASRFDKYRCRLKTKGPKRLLREQEPPNMISATCAPPVLDLIVQEWVLSASEQDFSQRRTHLRYPFVRAAEVKRQGTTISALSRDISPRGIGLLHREPLDLGPATVTVVLGRRSVDLDMHISWTSPDDGGWRCSGGEFSRISSIKYSSLILSTFTHEIERRYHSRYPFFQPVSVIERGRTELREESAYSLDISEGGIGLLSPRRFDTGRELLLTTRSQIGTQINLYGRVVANRALDNGSFVTGVKFAGDERR